MCAAQRLELLRRALAHLEGGNETEAECICRRLALDDNSDLEALLLLGLATGMRGDVHTAAAVLDRVARQRTEKAHPCSDLAALLIRGGKGDLIAPLYRECLRLAPDDLRLHYSFAAFLRENGDADAAVDLLGAVVRKLPANAEAHDQMGLALAEAGRFGEAVEQFRHAIACDPRPAAFWANLGMILKIESQFDAALHACDEALARAPCDRQIRVNRAVALLRAGRFAEAWQDWAMAEATRSGLPAERLLPALSRLPDLSGRTVLVVHEEGFGDTLQFVRYVPLLACRGARVVLAVPPPLVRLLQTIPGVADVPDGLSAVPAYDFHCSFNGLPRAFETTLQTIPCKLPYLSADTALFQQWGERLATAGAFRVGLCWAGQARPWLPGFNALDARRSTKLATLGPLAEVPGVSFVSLQKGPAAAEVSTAGFDLFDVMDGVRDFADTAAIVANLNMVISVDTSVVHLAGGLGKPVFLLDRYDNCWRWLSEREDSPWYPTLRIFRQPAPGDWSSVISRVAAALTQMVQAHSATADRPCPAQECRGAA